MTNGDIIAIITGIVGALGVILTLLGLHAVNKRHIEETESRIQSMETKLEIIMRWFENNVVRQRPILND